MPETGEPPYDWEGVRERSRANAEYRKQQAALPKMPKTQREKVAAFGEAMRAELDANSHKRGWMSCTTVYLMRRLRNETKGLAEVLRRVRRTGMRVRHEGTSRVEVMRLSPEARREILSEAADVANFAMMIADVCGALED